MAQPFLAQKPEIIHSALVGPGAAIPAKDFPVYLYIVYCFPCHVYTGFPECVPSVDPQKVIQAFDSTSVPKALRRGVHSIMVFREDDFLRACMRGSLWPIVTLFTETAETFTESGVYLREQRERFLSRDAIKRWLAAEMEGEKGATDAAVAWSYAEKACRGRFGASLPHAEAVTVRRRLDDVGFRASEKERLSNLYRDSKLSLPAKIKREELNDILITVRGLA